MEREHADHNSDNAEKDIYIENWLRQSIKSTWSKSSLSKAASLKASVKKGAKNIARPFKKLKQSFSNSSSRSSYSRASTVPSLSDNEAGVTTNKSGSERGSLDGNESEPELTPEQELEALKKTWRSPIYAFFKPDVTLQYHENRPCHFFACAASKCKLRTGGVRRFQDSKDKASTANLKHHATRCFGEDAINAAIAGKQASERNGSIFTLFARKGKQLVKYSHRAHTNPEVRAHLVKWVTENNRPINVINDRELRDLLTAGRPNINLPSSDTISRDIHASFEKCRERIAKLLQEHPGRLHFATDAWTSPNHRAFVAWTVHLEYEGEMLSFLIDIIELPESHTGIAMAKAFQAMLERFGLTEKILAVNADNATANDKQTTKLNSLNNSFNEENRVRCFNHTIQLSATTLLKPFNTALSRKAADEVEVSEEDAEEELLPEIEEEDEDEGEDDDDQDDEDDGIDELEELTESERERVLENTAVVRQTVTKVRQLSFAIINSTTIALPAWRRTCSELGLKDKLIPRDVVTRWNSTYDMMSFVLIHRTAIDKITADKALKLRKYELDNDDWVIVEDLVSVLETYKKATLFFSQDTASIAAVIPAMDKLDSHLNPRTKKPYHSAIQAAMKLARKKINRYYSMTDLSSAYRIAMVLHPGLKLEYFRQQGWEEEWVDNAENLAREEYIVHYEGKEDRLALAPEAADNADDDDFSAFANISVTKDIGSRTGEFDAYLRKPVENVKAPLKWWIANRHLYPNLYRMALDYLSIPATSTAVERVFSQGRQLLSFTRNRLRASSIRAFLCLGSWGRNDLIFFEDVLAAVKAGSKRKREASDLDVELVE